MRDCEQIRVDLVPFIAGEASEGTVSRLKSHLQVCADCRAELEELRTAADLVRTSPVELAPPEGLEQRTFELIERHGGVAPRGETIDAPVPLMPEERPRRRIRVRKPRTRKWERPRLAAMLAPGIAAALVLLGFVGVRLYQENDELRDQVAQQEERFGRLGTNLDTVTLTSVENSDMQVVADIYKLEDHNYQIVIDAKNFPPCPDKFQYELWLGGPSGWSSAGSFKTTGDEVNTFQLHVAVDPTKFPTMDLTLERINGDPDRTGTPVMQTRLNPSAL